MIPTQPGGPLGSILRPDGASNGKALSSFRCQATADASLRGQRWLAILNRDLRDEMRSLSNSTQAVREIDDFYFHFSPSPGTLEEVQILSHPWDMSMQ